MDIKFSKELNKYAIYSAKGTNKVDIDLFDAIKLLEDKGIGELLINNIDLDGTYEGFDDQIILEIVKASSVPVTTVGGASSLNNIKDLWAKTNVSGIAAGSLWSFIGNDNTVLLNYPNNKEKQSLFELALKDKNCNN